METGHLLLFPFDVDYAEGRDTRDGFRYKAEILRPSDVKEIAHLSPPAITLATRISVGIDDKNNPSMYSAVDRSRDLGIRVKISRGLRIKINLYNVAQYMGMQFPEDFSSSFGDLREFADAKGIVDFDALHEALSKENLSESPAFEVFGVKFSADTAAIGGPVVLLSVQLYFFIYLRRLNGKLSPNDAGWDVPWLGMDSSVLARSVFFSTVVLLPIVALIVQSITMNSHAMNIREASFPRSILHGYSDALDRLQLRIDVVLTLAIISVILGLLSWKNRPRLVAENILGNPPA